MTFKGFDWYPHWERISKPQRVLIAASFVLVVVVFAGKLLGAF